MDTLKKDQNWQVGEVELVYKTRTKPSSLPKITSSKISYDVFMKTWSDCKIEHVEQSKLMLLNRANRVIGMYELSSGGVDSTVIDARIAFSAALLANASAIILAHNHPSGNLKPSQLDRSITTRIAQAGKLLNIELLDHLIVTAEGYFSFADEGLM